MGSFDAVALRRVSRGDVTSALAAQGVAWSSASHVTATTSLTRAVRDSGAYAIPVATLRDMAVMPGLPDAMALPLSAFWPGGEPEMASRHPFETNMSGWQDEATGRRLRIGVQVDDSLRRFVREEADAPLGRALLASRRAYASTVHTLIASGVSPGDVEPKDSMGRLAVRAWARAEDEVAALGAPRQLTWIDPDEVSAGTSDAVRRLHERLRASLAAAFGQTPDAGRRKLIHHGFYFYTPSQWRFFQLLRGLPEVDQTFVVHDDGDNPVFATWRYFFRKEWGMPVPTMWTGGISPETAAASWFRGTLTGDDPGSCASVRLIDYRSPVDLVRDWSHEDRAAIDGRAELPTRYAAAARDVDRFVRRLGRSGNVSAPHLSQLPVGNFLLTLHSCIRRLSGGRPVVEVTTDQMLDLVASGFIDSDQESSVRIATLRRALPYFRDCRSAQQWSERAALLRLAVDERVARLGARNVGHSDEERMSVAAQNPLRLAPWVDLTTEEAGAVTAAVNGTIALIEEIVRRERVVLGDHLDRVHRTLERVLGTLPTEERDAIESKIRGFGVLTQEEVDVDGLVDVVAMLVGRTADFDPAQLDDEDPEVGEIRQLRGLDALGLVRSQQDIHIANLAEDVFPSSVAPVGWPFSLDDVRHATKAGLDPVVLELLETRGATAAISDLYLMWLALDGTEESAGVTLSWVSQSAGERRRLAPLVALLGRLRHDIAIDAVAGGVAAESLATKGDDDVIGSRPDPTATHPVADAVLRNAVNAVPSVAAASALACSRRFAIQWALGPSAGFEPEYLTTMLAGNAINQIQQTGRENVMGASAAGRAVWPQLTEGQRETSLDKAVVKSRRGRGADPSWVWMLGGNGRGSRPLDRAYRAAASGIRAQPETIVPAGSAFLPLGMNASEVCSRCPVQNRCLQRRFADR